MLTPVRIIPNREALRLTKPRVTASAATLGECGVRHRNPVGVAATFECALPNVAFGNIGLEAETTARLAKF